MPSRHASLLAAATIVGNLTISPVVQAYDFATGAENGRLNRLGSGIAEITKEYGNAISEDPLASRTTGGFVDNARLLREGQAQFAFVDSLTAHWVREALGPFADDEPFDGLKAIAILWHEVDHFVIDNDALQSGTISDFNALSSLRVSVSDQAATQVNSNEQVLNQTGGAIDAKVDIDALTSPSSVQRLDYRQIGGLAVTSPVPSSIVSDALENMPGGGVLVGMTSGQFASLSGRQQGAWTPFRIPAASYEGQTAAVDTAARPIMLVVRSDVSDEYVFQLTQSLFANLPALAEAGDLGGLISLENAVSDDLPLPLHPGAGRYFQQVGLVTANDIFERVQTNQDPLARRDSTIDPWKAYRPLQSIVFSGSPEGTRSRTFVSFFDFNSVDLDEPAEATVQDVADFAKRFGKAEIFVAGHTDRSGSQQINERVAQARANSVVERLVDLGYDEQLITSKSFGEDNPAISTADDEQHQQNRRVETVVSVAATEKLAVAKLDRQPDEEETDIANLTKPSNPSRAEGLPRLIVEGVDGNEGDGDLTLTLRLSQPSDSPVVLIVTQLNGTATAGQDFENSPSVITLKPGETTTELKTGLIDDNLTEGDESFELRISGSSDHVAIPKEPITITIVDND